MKLSVIIPAFNEEKYIEPCLGSIRAALAAHSGRIEHSEIIVTDNNSTDRTAEIAESCGARVVFEEENQISRARNAGAAQAFGDWLLFVDADSIIPPATLGNMLDHIESRRFVGGSSALVFDEASLSARLLCTVACLIMRILNGAGGAFLFVRADAFRKVGGFSLDVYAAEELILANALKRWGRAHGLRYRFMTEQPYITSSRKLRHYRYRDLFKLFMLGALQPRKTLGSRDRLGFFYDGKR